MSRLNTGKYGAQDAIRKINLNNVRFAMGKQSNFQTKWMCALRNYS